MIIQFNPYIPLLTPAGVADAFAMSDTGTDDFPLFYCFMENGIVCIFQSTEVRRIQNITMNSLKKDILPFSEESLNKWAFVTKMKA